MSNNLNLDQMTVGQANKEATVNTVSGQMDAALTETYVIDLAAGNVTLTNEQYRRAVRFKVINCTVAGRTVTLPAIKRFSLWMSDTANTQTFNIVMGSTTKPMAAGTAAMCYSDGTTNGLESYSLIDASGITVGTISGFNEGVDDRVAALLFGSGGITITYNDAANTLTIGTSLTSANISGFDESVDDRVAALLTAGTNISFSYNDAGNALTINASSGGAIAVSDEGTSLTSALSSMNFVGAGVTATNTGGAVTVTIPGGGGGGSSTPFLQWTAKDNQPPATNMATIDTRNNHIVLDFDTTTQETAIFAGVMPAGYTGGALTVTVYAALTSAVTGTLGWDVAIERIQDGVTDLDVDDFATAQTITAATVPGTSGMIMKSSVTITAGANTDNLAAGDAFRLRIRRDVANDTAAGDAELLRVTLKE